MTRPPRPPSEKELKAERVDLEGPTTDRESSPAAAPSLQGPVPRRFEAADGGRSLALTHQFSERARAMAFVGLVARLAEHAGACPKIEHVLGQVRVSLTTYEEGEVTERDRRLAELLELTLDLLEPREAA